MDTYLRTAASDQARMCEVMEGHQADSDETLFIQNLQSIADFVRTAQVCGLGVVGGEEGEWEGRGREGVGGKEGMWGGGGGGGGGGGDGGSEGGGGSMGGKGEEGEWEARGEEGVGERREEVGKMLVCQSVVAKSYTGHVSVCSSVPPCRTC